MAENVRRLDSSNRAYYHLQACNRWLTVWLDRKKERGTLTCTLSKMRGRSETHYVAREDMRNFVA